MSLADANRGRWYDGRSQSLILTDYVVPVSIALFARGEMPARVAKDLEIPMSVVSATAVLMAQFVDAKEQIAEMAKGGWVRQPPGSGREKNYNRWYDVRWKLPLILEFFVPLSVELVVAGGKWRDIAAHHRLPVSAVEAIATLFEQLELAHDEIQRRNKAGPDDDGGLCMAV